MLKNVERLKVFQNFNTIVEFILACLLAYGGITSASDTLLIQGFILLAFSFFLDIKCILLIINEKLN